MTTRAACTSVTNDAKGAIWSPSSTASVIAAMPHDFNLVIAFHFSVRRQHGMPLGPGGLSSGRDITTLLPQGEHHLHLADIVVGIERSRPAHEHGMALRQSIRAEGH